ncbi:MAG: hypothetical protein JXQ75_07040 [Phycisphaerae bacterium]|nr:hypothetical protein [Phycisphaerae bacterium]
MAVRSIQQLERDQAALLAAYKNRLAGAVAGGVPSVTMPRPALQWGRVTQVVTSDEQFGPHLMVQGYIYTGSPPEPTEAAAAAFRCYPAPGKAVTDYSVNDYVRLTPAAEAVIGELIA